MAEPPIFGDIARGDLEAVKSHVLADAGVLEEREPWSEHTPLMHAIAEHQPAIALWLIEHRGGHDRDTTGELGYTALLTASNKGPLAVVLALVAAGAKPTCATNNNMNPLHVAVAHPDILAFLLTLPRLKAKINSLARFLGSPLSSASADGHEQSVQILLDAGADPTIPACDRSPLNLAIRRGHPVVADMLRCAMMPRPYALHKARALLDAAQIIRKAREDARNEGEPSIVQRQQAIAAAPVYLRGRVERNEVLLPVGLTPQQRPPGQQGRKFERVRATVAFVVGFGDESEYKNLPEELFKELLQYMLPAGL